MATPRRAPRSTKEVRALTLQAATQLFVEHGYAQTSMRDIAAHADISLSVLYRHFEGKEELFAATLLAPFLEAFEDFSSAWRDQVHTPWEDERLVGEFICDLHRHTTEHRHSLVTLLAAGEDSTSSLLAETRVRLEGGLDALERMADKEAERRNWLRRENLALSNSLIISMVVGAVLLQPLLAASLDNDEALVEAATRLAIYGMRVPEAE